MYTYIRINDGRLELRAMKRDESGSRSKKCAEDGKLIYIYIN